MSIVIIDGSIHVLCPMCGKPQPYGRTLRHMDKAHKGWDKR
jgi:hypothetical protein